MQLGVGSLSMSPARVAGQALATVTEVTSATHRGVTWTFSVPVQVGSFVTGEPFVVSDRAFEITGMTPDSATVNGQAAYGVMLNPWFGDTDTQGFDGFLGQNPNGQTAWATTYDAALNVDPSLSGAIAIAPNFQGTYVKALRDPDKTDSTTAYVVEDCVPLHVVSAIPPADAYPPAMSATEKVIYARSHVSLSPRNFALPASWPTVAEILAAVPAELANFHSNQEKNRYGKLDGAAGLAQYSAQWVQTYARFVAAVNCSDVTNAQRQTIIDKIMRFGIEIDGLARDNRQINSGAGQGGGLWLWGMAAALLMRDSAMLARITGHATQPQNSPFWVSSADLSRVPTAGKSTPATASQPFLAAQIGQPSIVPDEMTSQVPVSRYGITASCIVAWETLALLPFSQGPAGYANGTEAILYGATQNSTANQRASILALTARYRQMTTTATGAHPAYGPSTAFRDMFDLADADFSEFTPWTGQPDQPPIGDTAPLNDTYFTAGAGSVTLNTQGISYATEAITQTDVRVSLDRVQWIERSNITLSGETYAWTGLNNDMAHYCGWRRHSASGASPWSPNYPYNMPFDSGLDHSLVMTGGAAATGAPTYPGLAAPALHYNATPTWEYREYEPVTGQITTEQLELHAGVGYPQGGRPTSYSYQWQVSDDGSTGWADISGATSKAYVVPGSQAAKYLRCNVSASNASGTATSATNVVQAPAAITIPAGTIIDTTFGSEFPFAYPDEATSFESAANNDDATATHEPTQTFSTLDLSPAAANLPGAMQLNKTGNFPYIQSQMSRNLAPGATYDWSVEVVVTQDGTAANNVNFRIGHSTDGSAYLGQFWNHADGEDVRNAGSVLTSSGSFTVPVDATGAELAPIVRLGVGTSTGLDAGEEAALTAVSIVARS